MYKDKDKQREANRQWMRRSRAKNKDSALSGSKAVSQNAQGLPVVDEVSDTQPVIPSKSVIPVILKRKTLAEIVNKECEGMAMKLKETLDNVIKPKPQSHSPMMVGYVPPER